MRICLDAGHTAQKTNLGVCAGHNEAKLMWKLHLALKKELEKYEDVIVHTFRATINDEVTAPKGYTVNVGRGRQAEKDDLFISLHDNACGTESVDRAVIIPSIQRTPQKLAAALAERLEKFWAKELGSTQKSQIYYRFNTSDPSWSYYGVLMGAEWVGKPGVIIEHSFHTNRAYCEWVMKDGNIEKLAKVDAEAIAEAYNLKLKDDGYDVGDTYVIKAGDKYTNGVAVPKRLFDKAYKIKSVRAGAVLLDGINSWVVVPTIEQPKPVATAKPKYKIGDTYTFKDGDVYSNGVKVPKRLVGTTDIIYDVKEDRILLYGIRSWVKI